MIGEHSAVFKIFICGLVGSIMGIYYVSTKFMTELYTIKICALNSKLYFN